MFTKNFSKHTCVKGVKIICKGRINGSRRKRTYVIKKGQTSTQSLKNEVSYHQEDCLTIFGILGIKVWIIY
jgi:small subunit ribosomal protein S3